jgi:DNA-binding NarL/FixJ family response regulator
MGSKQTAQVSRRARVLIVDDHPLVREGLAARISAQPDLEVCGEAADLDTGLAMIGTTRPALVILDLAFKHGSGLDLIKKIKARGSRPKVLVVSAYDEALFAERALRAGAQGYINKQELQGSVIEAIRKLLRGELFLSAEMTQQLAGQAFSGRNALQGIEALSDRELQIFQLIGRGMTTRAIAEELRLSVHTVESHRENIRLKLGLRNGTQLLQRAVLWSLESNR